MRAMPLEVLVRLIYTFCLTFILAFFSWRRTHVHI